MLKQIGMRNMKNKIQFESTYVLSFNIIHYTF